MGFRVGRAAGNDLYRPRGAPPMEVRRRELAKGLAATLLALALVEALVLVFFDHRAFPGAVLAPTFLAVVYAAFTGGMRGGLLSAAIVSAYASYAFLLSLPSGAPSEGIVRAVIVSASALGVALLVGRLKRQNAAAHEAMLAAERRHAARLQEANRDLTRANESLRALTYVVSHDLREPAHTADGYLRFLEDDAGPRLDPGSRVLLHQARIANGRLLGLVDSLVDLSRAARIDASQLRPCRVEDALRDPACAARFEGAREEKGARVEVAPDIPPVLASHDVLCQVLGALVLNAVKHGPDRGGTVRVSGRALPGGSVEVLVEDDGPGFPRRILERFGSSEAWDNLPSTSHPRGFGLTIAARAAAALGGRLGIGASPGLGGALVRLELPAG